MDNETKQSDHSIEFLKSYILGRFPAILSFADAHRICKRKSVGCCIIQVHEGMVSTLAITTNGPSGLGGHECTNVVGNCGCSHAEPRSVMQLIESGLSRNRAANVLVCTYSPCTTCANIILDSHVIDLCVYDILTEHDKRGDEFLRMELPVYTKRNLESGDFDASLEKWLISMRRTK